MAVPDPSSIPPAVTPAVTPTPTPSDKAVSPPAAPDPAAVVPTVDPTQQVPLMIYLRVRAVPEWAWRAREVYPPAVGAGLQTLGAWDAIFKDF